MHRKNFCSENLQRIPLPWQVMTHAGLSQFKEMSLQEENTHPRTKYAQRLMADLIVV